MSAIPLHDLDEVATKGDIAGLRAEIKIDIAQLRTELTSKIAVLRKTMTNWMLTVLVAVIGAMVGTGLLTQPGETRRLPTAGS